MSSHDPRQPGLRQHSIGGVYPLVISGFGDNYLYLWSSLTGEVINGIEYHDGSSQSFKEAHVFLEEIAHAVLEGIGE